ncbi:MAG: hypothetical protein HRT47_05080 [Candidatus Caenarcaniphilales bacterium]|nr:hypothetical protein [Candidatus Caenarcaniphilales bacterium]
MTSKKIFTQAPVLPTELNRKTKTQETTKKQVDPIQELRQEIDTKVNNLIGFAIKEFNRDSSPMRLNFTGENRVDVWTRDKSFFESSITQLNKILQNKQSSAEEKVKGLSSLVQSNVDQFDGDQKFIEYTLWNLTGALVNIYQADPAIDLNKLPKLDEINKFKPSLDEIKNIDPRVAKPSLPDSGAQARFTEIRNKSLQAANRFDIQELPDLSVSASDANREHLHNVQIRNNTIHYTVNLASVKPKDSTTKPLSEVNPIEVSDIADIEPTKKALMKDYNIEALPVSIEYSFVPLDDNGQVFDQNIPLVRDKDTGEIILTVPEGRAFELKVKATSNDENNGEIVSESTYKLTKEKKSHHAGQNYAFVAFDFEGFQSFSDRAGNYKRVTYGLEDKNEIYDMMPTINYDGRREDEQFPFMVTSNEDGSETTLNLIVGTTKQPFQNGEGGALVHKVLQRAPVFAGGSSPAAGSPNDGGKNKVGLVHRIDPYGRIPIKIKIKQ